MIAPKLRFSEFKDEWIEKKIGNLINIKSGLGFKADEYVTEKEIPLLQIENVGYGSIKWGNNVKYVPTEYLKKHENLALKINDIVLALNRPVTNDQLKISKLTSKDIPSILYQRVGKIETKDLNIDSSFIFQYFQIYLKDYIVKSSLGSDQPFISILDLYAQKIEIPQIQEQTKIAEFLSAVDDKISQLTRQLELLNQYKKGVMQKIFSQEIRFKNDNGEDFGEWEEVKFSDIFIEIKDKVGNKNIETYSITAGKGFVSQSEKFGRDISGSQNENYIVLGKKDFSYNKGNSKTYKFGCVYLNNTGQNIAVPNVFISFRAKKNNIAHNFYAKLFEHHYLDRYLRQLISSSARMDGLLNISKEGFFEIPLPFPSKPEQEKIAEFLTAIDERIDHTTAQLTHTKQWKKGLLQQMFV